ncbi:uncharacterized protein LOC126743895 [Anthonomus grandis grandis]|uniref:uncharacterized protein LOC126743895 n=1 Tax=Anthonomus grandis grandis TaxID=2921223 RepID=UPI0021665C15|nr:uncharacterized protein LOC126743895 [Anthonomus grandis grandis]XP_050307111.1 uncharacterized protein LOC126743895 [Anthonomus grandis grandis]XP_050307112.1 uncharacterized protein LOC126743895 [Anthonomus grandis grandis]
MTHQRSYMLQRFLESQSGKFKLEDYIPPNKQQKNRLPEKPAWSSEEDEANLENDFLPKKTSQHRIDDVDDDDLGQETGLRRRSISWSSKTCHVSIVELEENQEGLKESTKTEKYMCKYDRLLEGTNISQEDKGTKIDNSRKSRQSRIDEFFKSSRPITKRRRKELKLTPEKPVQYPWEITRKSTQQDKHNNLNKKSETIVRPQQEPSFQHITWTKKRFQQRTISSSSSDSSSDQMPKKRACLPQSSRIHKLDELEEKPVCPKKNSLLHENRFPRTQAGEIKAHHRRSRTDLSNQCIQDNWLKHAGSQKLDQKRLIAPTKSSSLEEILAKNGRFNQSPFSSEGFHEILSPKVQNIDFKVNKFGTKFNIPKTALKPSENCRSVGTQTSFNHEPVPIIIPDNHTSYTKYEPFNETDDGALLKQLGLNDKVFSGSFQNLLDASQRSGKTQETPKSEKVLNSEGSCFKLPYSESMKTDIKGDMSCQSSCMKTCDSAEIKTPKPDEKSDSKKKIHIISDFTTTISNFPNIFAMFQAPDISTSEPIINETARSVTTKPDDDKTPAETEDIDEEFAFTQSQLIVKEPESNILHGANLLKELLQEKAGIERKLVKNKLKYQFKKEDEKKGVLAQTYMKKYKKGDLKIYKLSKRFEKREKRYVPPEEQIMENFMKKMERGFDDCSSVDSNDRAASVSTPLSYETDDTRSEVLSTGSLTLTDPQKLLREGINRLSKDDSLLFSRWSDEDTEPFNRLKILIDVQEFICQLLEDYQNGLRLAFTYPKVRGNVMFENNRYKVKDKHNVISVSRNTLKAQCRFNIYLFTLNKVRMLLETNTKISKRELYYLLKSNIPIKCQSTTDSVVYCISRMFNVGVWALNITAQKGLVYGNLKLVMENGETLNCNVPTGTLIPHSLEDICEIQSDAYFIIVVEKEAIFYKLLEENLPKRLTRPFILATGKGYADLNTQLFLKKLWMVLTIPVFILVDADPDGISIMLNYRFGSLANAHVSEHLAIPKAKWLGVFPSDITAYQLQEEELTKREFKKIESMLQMECVKQNQNIQNELKIMLRNGVKAGIESLIKTDNYLSHRYLGPKFYLNNLI